MPQPHKVIILGCTHGGLAVARSLGKRNIQTLVLTYKDDEFGLVSRYVKEWHLCPHPRDEQAFIDNLLHYADEWRDALIFDTNDYFLQVLSRNKTRLAEHFRIISPDWEQAQIFLEKNRAYRLADECGVPHPKVVEPKTMQELENIIDTLAFPVMIKPVNSHEFVSIFKTKLFIIETVEELREKFREVVEAQQSVIVSEIIPGTDYGTLERIHTYINTSGDVAAMFSNIKLRQTPPMYGVMRVGKSVPPNLEASALATKLLQAVDYRGFASVEFKRDYRDNQLKLMEVNIRMPRSLALPIKSGIDFPYLIFQDLVNHDLLSIDTYHHDTYLIEIIADVADFVRYDTERSFGKFIAPYFAKNKTFSYFQFSDPMPFIMQIARRANRFFRKKSGFS